MSVLVANRQASCLPRDFKLWKPKQYATEIIAELAEFLCIACYFLYEINMESDDIWGIYLYVDDAMTFDWIKAMRAPEHVLSHTSVLVVFHASFVVSSASKGIPFMPLDTHLYLCI